MLPGSSGSQPVEVEKSCWAPRFGPMAQGSVVAELFPHVILEKASGKGSVRLIINSIFVTALLGLLISCVKTTNEMTQLQSLIGIMGQ